MELMLEFDRYSRVTAWAKARYKKPDGAIITWVGNGVAGRPMRDGRPQIVPSRYSVIEELAAARYLGIKRKWPDETLATAYAA